MIIDPPEGWRYGFPKEYYNPGNVTLDVWLISNGYPWELIDQGMSEYCRFWGSDNLIEEVSYIRHRNGWSPPRVNEDTLCSSKRS